MVLLIKSVSKFAQKKFYEIDAETFFDILYNNVGNDFRQYCQKGFIAFDTRLSG